MDQRRLTTWIEDLPARGRYTFDRREAERVSSSSTIAVQSVLRRLKQKGRIVSPRRGFYVVVPAEHRAAGCPPASWFIDDLMRYLGRRYYVSLLSGAALHGAAHQKPMVFQLLTDRGVRVMQAGRVHIEPHTSRRTTRVPVQSMQTETGSMTVATPETTAFDLVHFPAAAGSWGNIANVLMELSEALDRERLVKVAPVFRIPDVQRLGFLLSCVGEGELASPLADWLGSRRTTVIWLRPEHPREGAEVDPRWRLIPNEVIEPDL